MRLVDLSDVSARRFSFSQNPVICLPEEYQSTRDKIVDQFAGIDGVISLYQIGSVGSPGISDLDVIVVLERQIEDQTFSYESFLDYKETYIAGHSSPFVMDLETFRKLNVFSYPSNMALIWGREIPREETPELHSRLYRISYVIDAALSELVYLAAGLLRGMLPLRDNLCHIHSVRFDIHHAVEDSGGHLPNSPGYEERTSALRNDWFELEKGVREQTLLDLNIMAIRILMDVLESHASRLARELGSEGMETSPLIFYFSGLNHLLRFGKDGHGKIYEILPAKNRFLCSFLVDLPYPVGLHLALYGNHDSVLGRRVRRRLIDVDNHALTSFDRGNLYKESIVSKMGILEDYRRFLSGMPSASKMVDGPWFGRSRMEEAKRYLWKLILWKMADE